MLRIFIVMSIMKIRSNTEDNEETFYEYDSFGNLRTVTLPDGTVIEYVIDGDNRRIGKKVNGVLEQGFLYKDKLNPIAELDEAGNVVSVFVYGSKFNVPDYIVTGGSTYRVVSDHLGSVRMVIDTSTGAVVQEMDFDEFGNVTVDTNPGFQPFGFGGGVYDVDTGFVRFGARDYDPESGRWTSKDPALFDDENYNVYDYSSNDPINYIDPDGEGVVCTTILVCVVGAYILAVTCSAKDKGDAGETIHEFDKKKKKDAIDRANKAAGTTTSKRQF